METQKQRHPNRVRFKGVLARVDEASDRAPSGARGHRVMLTKKAAEEALHSLIGMGVGLTSAMDGHDARRKVGVITEAEVAGKEIVVRGHLFARDFPEVLSEIKKESPRLGMSYELTDAHVEDIHAAVWKLTQVTFTGAAVLLRHKAAYANTSLQIEARGEGMNETQMQEWMAMAERMAAATEKLTEVVQKLDAQSAEVSAKLERIVAAVEEEEPGVRKTLSPAVTALLAKHGVEDGEGLDEALKSLSVEQRVAVKMQLARAGKIG